MITLSELLAEKVLRVGDEVRYQPFMAGAEKFILNPQETGMEFEQSLFLPESEPFWVREIFSDGSMDICPQKCYLKVAFGGMKGFCNAKKILKRICKLYDNFLYDAYARCYSLKDLRKDTKNEYLFAEKIRLACYPKRAFRRGTTNNLVRYHQKEYYEDYSLPESHRFYYSDGGGHERRDSENTLFRVSSQDIPVFVTGHTHKMHCQTEDTVKNFWLPEKSVLISNGNSSTMLEYLCYIDRNGYLEYEFFCENKVTESRLVRPIIHVEPTAKIEDVYVGYKGDKRICQFPRR